MATLRAVFAGAFLLVLSSFTASCGGPTQPSVDPLKGGIVASFEVAGEQFRAWITNPTTIQQVLALRPGQSREPFPNGRLRTGSGAADHNAPYSWHLDPDDTQMVEVTIELCDGRPSYVEQNRDAFIREVGRYCPWGATLVAVADHR